MTWDDVVTLLRRELGGELAATVDRLVRGEFRGQRLSIPSRRRITAALANEVAPGRPQEAARALKCHPATVYRVIRGRSSLIR
jgi:hypothetical protein